MPLALIKTIGTKGCRFPTLRMFFAYFLWLADCCDGYDYYFPFVDIMIEPGSIFMLFMADWFLKYLFREYRQIWTRICFKSDKLHEWLFYARLILVISHRNILRGARHTHAYFRYLRRFYNWMRNRPAPTYRYNSVSPFYR